MELNINDHELFKVFLNDTLFNNKTKNDIEEGSNSTVELIVRPECNQKCEYCYITKYGDKLYPKELRVDNKTIINNIKMLLEYFYNNKCYVKSWELFAGDMFYDDLFFDIIELFYDYYLKIKNNHNDIYKNTVDLEELNDENYNRSLQENVISIPCNFSFCHSPEKIKRFKEVFYRMLEVNTYISLSYSTDGIYAIDHREKRTTVTQEFYNRVFELCNELTYGCHPMISYENVDVAIDNYEWWKEMFKNHLYDLPDFIPCMLEVRNEGWTEESIDKYLKFLDYIVDDRIKIYNNDLELFVRQVFGNDLVIDKTKPVGPKSMDPISLKVVTKNQNRMSCTLGHSLCINCAHLTFVPCHRLAYPFFEGGKFVIDKNNEQIIDVEAKENISGYFNQIFTNVTYKPKCYQCKYRFFCIKGCHGAQFEANGDPNIPIPSVCNLLQKKINFLCNKYHKLGIFKILFENPEQYLCYGLARNRIIDLLSSLGYEEYQKYYDKQSNISSFN